MATSLISGSLAAQAQTSMMQSREDSALKQIQSAQGSKSDSKIDKSAKEFESMLLTSWLQQAEQSMATVPGAEDDEDAPGKDQMMSLGVQSLASSMVASGGIGIASMISKALHAAADKNDQSTTGTAAGPAQVKGNQIEKRY
jgi:Rod binding domain-containing protein